MSEKTAKVAHILSVRPKDHPTFGTTYYFKLEMDNGDVGEIGKKKKDAFVVGTSLTYTIEPSEYGDKFKEVNQNGFGGRGNGGNSARGGNESFALSYAKDLMVKKLDTSDLNAQEIVKGTLWMASQFKTWLDENK